MSEDRSSSREEDPYPSGCRIAIFDFDATLAQGDSLWPFLETVAGSCACYTHLFSSLSSYFFVPEGKGRRTALKEELLHKTLAGRNISSIQHAIDRMQFWPRWLPTLNDLRRHHQAGHHILIASGSLDLYMPTMLRDVPYDGLICTEMERDANGVLTGRMVSGNCVRKGKAERVKAYMQAHGPFIESWGYGNAPHDLPMLELVDHAHTIP
ncbi:MAG: HAD family hydrolase [Alphaproteobacteria bacterium]|nr:HAD family hydrolase [Alphaproteobacteria bacterium]